LFGDFTLIGRFLRRFKSRCKTRRSLNWRYFHRTRNNAEVMVTMIGLSEGGKAIIDVSRRR